MFERLVQSPVESILAGDHLITSQQEIGSPCAQTTARGCLIHYLEHTAD